MASILMKDPVENIIIKKQISGNEKVSKEKYRFVSFHGKDIRTKKFQKRINRKAKLTRIILVNSVIIIATIMVLGIAMRII